MRTEKELEIPGRWRLSGEGNGEEGVARCSAIPETRGRWEVGPRGQNRQPASPWGWRFLLWLLQPPGVAKCSRSARTENKQLSRPIEKQGRFHFSKLISFPFACAFVSLFSDSPLICKHSVHLPDRLIILYRSQGYSQIPKMVEMFKTSSQQKLPDFQQKGENLRDSPALLVFLFFTLKFFLSVLFIWEAETDKDRSPAC